MATQNTTPSSAAAYPTYTAPKPEDEARDEETKRRHMHILAEYKKQLYRSPQLKDLFLELTLRCNENCLHCGSRCGDVPSVELTLEQYQTFLTGIKRDFAGELPRLCITGGEPLLRKDFWELMGWAHEQGFHWGMTSNATLITPQTAHRLRETGMTTISVSIDGLEASHDAFRRTPGAYRRAMQGIQNLIDEGGFQHIQVTTVMNHRTIHELEAMYEIFENIDIDSWRIVGMEPIGRALEHPDLLMKPEDHRYLLDFIRDKRKEDMPLLYGCSHYLGPEYETEVRDWYFLCNAGIYVASVMANGDIGACLDIERRPETIMGNILRDDFKDVWYNRFQIFRQNPGSKCSTCTGCDSYEFCGGGSWHSWDLTRNEQKVCMKDVLF